MIESLGLPWTLRIIGCISCCVNLLATFYIKDRNAFVRPKQRPFDRDLVCHRSVLWLLAWAFMSMLGYITLLYSLSDFSLSINLDRTKATNITALLNLGTAFGRPCIGVVSDRLGRFEVATGLTFLCGLTCFALWVPATSYALTIIFALVSGAVLGVFWVVSSPNFVQLKILLTDELRLLGLCASKSRVSSSYPRFWHYLGYPLCRLQRVSL